jgi:hypothetical protein
VLISCLDGGYVLGNNSYGDVCKGEFFPVTLSYVLEGGIFWFGDKTITGTPDTLEFAAWVMNGYGGSTSAGSHNQICPGSKRNSIKVPMDAVDTSSSYANAHVALFSVPEIMYYDYLLGFDLTGFVDDTIGMVSSSNGEGDSLERVWEKWSDGNWYTLQAAGYEDYSLDIDAMIFPIVDMTNAGLCESPFVNGIRMNLYPNPVSEILTVTAEMQEPSVNVRMMLLDANGRTVIEPINISAAALGAGYQINLSSLPAGNYYLLMNSGSSKLAQKIAVSR